MSVSAGPCFRISSQTFFFSFYELNTSHCFDCLKRVLFYGKHNSHVSGYAERKLSNHRFVQRWRIEGWPHSSLGAEGVSTHSRRSQIESNFLSRNSGYQIRLKDAAGSGRRSYFRYLAPVVDFCLWNDKIRYRHFFFYSSPPAMEPPHSHSAVHFLSPTVFSRKQYQWGPHVDSIEPAWHVTGGKDLLIDSCLDSMSNSIH